jgi:methylmalonyl-CoA/ethylmalonyl-CoA epimerase
MLKKILHIGVIVRDFERGIEKFKAFGFPCTQVIENEQIGAKIAFLPIGDTVFEFIHHTKTLKKGQNPMTDVVTSQEGTINHVCFEVDDLDSTIRHFEKNGAKLVEGCPRPGAHGHVAFFYPETTEGLLIELCEVKQ